MTMRKFASRAGASGLLMAMGATLLVVPPAQAAVRNGVPTFVWGAPTLLVDTNTNGRADEGDTVAWEGTLNANTAAEGFSMEYSLYVPVVTSGSFSPGNVSAKITGTTVVVNAEMAATGRVSAPTNFGGTYVYEEVGLPPSAGRYPIAPPSPAAAWVNPLIQVTPTEPTFTDACGGDNIAVSLPLAKDGVAWDVVNSSNVSGDTRITATATPEAGYTFGGAKSIWSQDDAGECLPDLVGSVTWGTPFLSTDVNENGVADAGDYVRFPYTVRYTGSEAFAAMHFRVADYGLSRFLPMDETGVASDGRDVLVTTGMVAAGRVEPLVHVVDYSVTYNSGSTLLNETNRALPASAPSAWLNPHPVTPFTPTFTDDCGANNITVATPLEQTGVNWAIDYGQDGTGNRTATAVATPGDGYSFASAKSSWTQTDAGPCPAVVDVVWLDPTLSVDANENGRIDEGDTVAFPYRLTYTGAEDYTSLLIDVADTTGWGVTVHFIPPDEREDTLYKGVSVTADMVTAGRVDQSPVTMSYSIDYGPHSVGNQTDVSLGTLTPPPYIQATEPINTTPSEFDPLESDLDGIAEGGLVICADGTPVVTVAHGESITVAGTDCSDLGDSTGTHLVAFSQPTILGADTFTVTIPEALAAGKHSLVLYASDGAVIGWQAITVTGWQQVAVTTPAGEAVVTPDTDSVAAVAGVADPASTDDTVAVATTGELSSTGAQSGMLALASLVLVGFGALALRLRAQRN
ncbi:hypothetical protein [Demequina aurantiaca]|uniref:hypothetical protein n=1 Tax=Demequina aurantiaca TaxID=676200 RepID=UPI003D34A11E